VFTELRSSVLSIVFYLTLFEPPTSYNDLLLPNLTEIDCCDKNEKQNNDVQIITIIVVIF
jgi:hypothetical protein